jgi:hypothetical protein
MNKIIPIGKIDEGMILSEPILNQFSQILIPSGVVLTDFHKTILTRWNISYVSVIVEDSDEVSTYSEDDYQIAIEFVNSTLLWQPSLEIETDLVNATAVFYLNNKSKIPELDKMLNKVKEEK